MKNLLIATLFFVFALGSATVNAQSAKTIQLEQTEGAFTIQSLTLAEGDYVFEISNNGVDHEVGFVLAPKGQTDPEHHIKNAYVQAPVKDGSSAKSQTVSLAKGEYVYFCPLNPTPQYRITVQWVVHYIYPWVNLLHL